MKGNELSPDMREFACDARFAEPVTPYRRGFEDCQYDHVYANPYPVGSAEWRNYCRGNEDARGKAREGAA